MIKLKQKVFVNSINTFEGLSNRARQYFASSQQHVFFILRCMQILLLLMLRSTTSLVLLLANGTMNRIYRLLIPDFLQGVTENFRTPRKRCMGTSHALLKVYAWNKVDIDLQRFCETPKYLAGTSKKCRMQVMYFMMGLYNT